MRIIWQQKEIRAKLSLYSKVYHTEAAHLRQKPHHFITVLKKYWLCPLILSFILIIIGKLQNGSLREIMWSGLKLMDLQSFHIKVCSRERERRKERRKRQRGIKMSQPKAWWACYCNSMPVLHYSCLNCKSQITDFPGFLSFFFNLAFLQTTRKPAAQHNIIAKLSNSIHPTQNTDLSINFKSWYCKLTSFSDMTWIIVVLCDQISRWCVDPWQTFQRQL